MNEKQLEQNVKQAFDQLHRPAGLDQRTLAKIQAAAQAEAGYRAQAQPQAAAQAEAGDLSQAQPHVPEGTASIVASSLSSAKIAASDQGEATLQVSVAKGGRKKAPNKGWSGFAFKAIAACLALALVGFGGFNAYQTPVAYADVEAAGGVELSVNGIDRVIGVTCLDDTGQEALDELAAAGINLQGMTYGEALEALTSTNALAGSDATAIQVTVACNDQDRSQKMQQDADACLGSREHACGSATMEEREAARAEGKGMHRYNQEQHGSGDGACQDGSSGAGNGACQDGGTGSGDGACQDGGSAAGNGNGSGSGSGNGNGTGSGNGAHNGNGAHHE